MSHLQTKLIAICTVAMLSLGGLGYAFLRYRSQAERRRRKLEKAERTVNIGAIFGMDVGGTLTKIVYFEKAGVLDRQDLQSKPPSMSAVSRAASDPISDRLGTGIGQGLRRTNSLSQMLEAPDHKRALQTLYEYMRTSKNPGTRRDDRLSFYSPVLDGCLHFLHFETRDMVKIIDQLTDASITENIRTIGCTGGGAHKYAKKVRDDLDIEILQLDELQCLIRGMAYALTQIPNECYTFRRNDGQSEEFQSPSRKEHTKKVSLPREHLNHTFPYLVVNIGSGVSILKVCGPNDYERVSGSSIGGGTYWGLCRLLTKSSSFENALDMAEKGDSSEIDMLVGDIYGGGYDGISLSPSTVASNFGKVVMQDDDKKGNLKDEDIAIAILMMITNNIGQVSYLNAKLHSCSKIFFVGSFLRLNAISCRRLSYAIDFWSKGKMEALFLEHEGYFGALGTFLRSSLGPGVDDIIFVPKQQSSEDLVNSENDIKRQVLTWLKMIPKLPSFQETFGGLPTEGGEGGVTRRSGKRVLTSTRLRTSSEATEEFLRQKEHPTSSRPAPPNAVVKEKSVFGGRDAELSDNGDVDVKTFVFGNKPEDKSARRSSPSTVIGRIRSMSDDVLASSSSHDG